MVATGATLPWQLTPLKKLRCYLILYRDIDGQIILLSNWKRDTTALIETKVVVSGVTFRWYYLQVKNQRCLLIPSRYIDDQRTLQFNFLRTFWAITEEPDFSQTSTFWTITKNITTLGVKPKNPTLEDFWVFSIKWDFFWRI